MSRERMCGQLLRHSLCYNFDVANCEPVVGLYESDRYRMLTYNLGRDKIGGTKVVLLELILRK